MTCIFSQLAQTILFQHYPKHIIPIISMSKEYTWLNKEIRKNLFGGLSAVFCRHAQIEKDESFPQEVYQTPNGSQITKIQQLGMTSFI